MASKYRMTYGGETVMVEADLAQASAPILVDGESIGRQVADASHRPDHAVLLAAKHCWPDQQWPALPGYGTDPVLDNPCWDELEYAPADDSE